MWLVEWRTAEMLIWSHEAIYEMISCCGQLQAPLESSWDFCGTPVPPRPLNNGCFSAHHRPPRDILPSLTVSVSIPLSLAFCESLLVSLSGEVMRGTSCGPYLSRTVILILPLAAWLPRVAGRQSGLGEYCSGRVSWARALWGPWEPQSCANSWTAVETEFWGSATLDVTEQWEIHFGQSEDIYGLGALLTWTVMNLILWQANAVHHTSKCLGLAS